ncbi:tRNA dihydrouridine synthase [Geofilum rubicundum]|uniref:tRNA-dihydrouridine synthase n=1 Tax=Geofilum rubicundum JCM 15548 TaxID=1236989 RepID=A0A0E9LU20_9BACT|nr:tRNA-dihydrouridine synthase [Geofilum rubicundum]GAO28754.1 tRNA dihydrouridine synthase B [Geofilum rubicundum JCM 15548]
MMQKSPGGQSETNFWHTTQGPLMMLAPMEDVTDTAFRELILRSSAPGHLHILFTEFTSTDGLGHPVGREKVSYRLKVSDGERELLQKNGVKLIAQIWGNKPEKFAEAVQHITENYAFDGIDINMGCPVKNVVAHGSCSALINQEPLAHEIIAASRAATHLPISVKTRMGLKKVDTERWMTFLLKQPLDAIILHGRIQKQMSEGIADWKEIAKAVQLRDQLAPDIKIIGNGDVDSINEALEKSEKYGVDGTMIGRGIFKNPWLFQPESKEISLVQRIETLKLHLELFEKCWDNTRHFSILRRFFKIYISDFQGAVDFRHQMMQVNSFDEARNVIKHWNQRLFPKNA